MSSTECPPITTALEAELDAALHETLDENDTLKADLKALAAENRRLLDWIMGDEPDALTYLQCTYSDPSKPEAVRTKTALGALPFERSKPASSNVVVISEYARDPAAYTRTIRLRQVELVKAQWAREAEVKPGLLGSDHEGEALEAEGDPPAA
jgi:hypothetical protein